MCNYSRSLVLLYLLTYLYVVVVVVAWLYSVIGSGCLTDSDGGCA